MKGYLLAALAAAFYGTNPIFAVPLYGMGLNVSSVLLYRYLLGVPALAAVIICRSEGLAIDARQTVAAGVVGLIMAVSSLALYEAYACMNPGLASTLLFMYPLFTTIIMILFFREKFRLKIGLSLAIMLAGLYLLMAPESGGSFNLKGFAWILLSSLTYAVYLVMVKVSKTVRTIPNLQSLLYQLLFGSLVFAVVGVCGKGLDAPRGVAAWANLGALALFPTVLSLLLTLKAIKLIGPTPTALFGGLEPLTAVVLSLIVLGESITGREALGGVLILLSTTLVMLGEGRETPN